MNCLRTLVIQTLLLLAAFSSLECQILSTDLCNVCLAANGNACRSESTFSNCDDEYIQSCPDGYVCSNGTETCYARSIAAPACSTLLGGNCRRCVGGYACVSEVNYVSCANDWQLNLLKVHKCSEGHVCSVAESNRSLECVFVNQTESSQAACYSIQEETTPAEETTATSTTETQTTTPATTPITTTLQTSSSEKLETTTNAPESPDRLCIQTNRTGFFENPQDASCKTYIYCFEYNKVWMGVQLKCPANQYFLPAGYCHVNKPENCH